MIRKSVLNVAHCAVPFALVLVSAAQAAGVSKTHMITVDETQLLGYLAKPPAGWSYDIQYVVATDRRAAEQKIVAVLSWSSSVGAGGPPPRSALTILSLSNGAILTKDYLPAEARLSTADCVNSHECPSLENAIIVSPDKSVPDRLLVNVSKFGSSSPAPFLYAFDPASGAVNRWTPFTGCALPKPSPAFSYGDELRINLFPFSNCSMSPPETNLYEFSRASATTTDVFQITSK